MVWKIVKPNKQKNETEPHNPNRKNKMEIEYVPKNEQKMKKKKGKKH